MNCENFDIIKKISSILNIHEERIILKKRISEKNELTSYSCPSGEYVFDNNKDSGILTQVHSFNNEDDISKKLNQPNHEIVIIQDKIHSNIEAQAKKMKETTLEEKNFIEIINDKYIINNKLCEDTINFLEKTIRDDPNVIETEKWECSRNVNAKYIPSEYVQKNNPKLFNQINKCYVKISSELEHIKYSSHQSGFHNNTFTIRKIYGPTRCHSDGIYNNNETKKDLRYASCIINLNNDYSGGDFIFEKQNFKYKMAKNDIIVFPPYYTHPHLTLPLENKTYRYTINTWFLVK